MVCQVAVFLSWFSWYLHPILFGKYYLVQSLCFHGWPVKYSNKFISIIDLYMKTFETIYNLQQKWLRNWKRRPLHVSFLLEIVFFHLVFKSSVRTFSVCYLFEWQFSALTEYGHTPWGLILLSQSRWFWCNWTWAHPNHLDVISS